MTELPPLDSPFLLSQGGTAGTTLPCKRSWRKHERLVLLAAGVAVPATHAAGPVQVDPVGRAALDAGCLRGVLPLRGALGVSRHGHHHLSRYGVTGMLHLYNYSTIN